MAYDVTLIPGDGVGPELAEAARMCVDATGVSINWDVQEAGVDVMAKLGTPVPDSVIESCRRTKVALKAPITTPVGTGFRSVNVYLRQALDLYACVRPCKQYPGVRTYFTGTKVDIVLVRENTEDLYLGVEFEKGKPETTELIADIKCMQLVQKPELYDVLVLPNLYGDIVSDLGAGLVGGLGVAPGANIGEAGAVFEATHGSAPKYKGQYKMNPTALILSAVLMLDHLSETEAAKCLENAVANVIQEGKSVTYDMKPSRDDPTAVGTLDMARAIIQAMGA